MRNSPLTDGVLRYSLPNGLSVILSPGRAFPVVSAQVWVRVGSVNEDDSSRGLSHFLEHLIFKGTPSFPGDLISRAVESLGGNINAATSKEYTQYHIDLPREGIDTALQILSEAVSRALLPADDINRERPVVIEEISRHNDDPGSVLYDLYTETQFPTTPYRYRIIGSSQIIRDISRGDIANFYHKWYVPANMVLSLAGDFDADAAKVMIAETFGRIAPGPAPSQPSLIETSTASARVAQARPVEHVYAITGYAGPDSSSNDQFAADVTATILGGGRSSRLYRILREKKRLVFSIGSSFVSQRGTGSLMISSIFDPGRENDVLTAIDTQVRALARTGPTEQEVARAVTVITSQWYFSQETCHDVASTLGYWTLQGRADLPATYIRGIEGVTPEDVSAYMRRYCDPGAMCSVMVVPRPAAHSDAHP